MGHGGQHVFIKPSKNLIIVTTADKTDAYREFGFYLDKASDIFDRIDKITN